MFQTWYDGPDNSLEHNISSLGLAADSGGATPHSPTTTSGLSSWTHPPTLIGSPNGLQIDLIWDSSVAAAPKGFVQAIVAAAELYTTLFSNKEVIDIAVGFGEIASIPLPWYALGVSASNGNLYSYLSVTQALEKDGFAFSATNEPTTSEFFVTNAEAKALGLTSGATPGVLDGWIGFSNLAGSGYSWNVAGKIGPTQVDLMAVAEHEISEVMGRIGFEGTNAAIPGYTPLDLFNYNSAGVLELSPNGGYFSINNGTTSLGVYNNASTYGGDIADWASALSPTQSNTLGLIPGDYDAFDAFTYPGYKGSVSASDIIEMAALGYKLTPVGVAALGLGLV